MSVDLRAIATLNAKPYLTALKTIENATRKVHTGAIAAERELGKATASRADLHKAAAQQHLREVRTVEGATKQATGSVRNLAAATALANAEQADKLRTTQRISEAIRTQTPLVARQTEALLNQEMAQRNLNRAREHNLTGNALNRYVNAAAAADRAAAQASARVSDDIIKQNRLAQATAAAAVEADRANNRRIAAERRGTESARAYTESMEKLSETELRRAQLQSRHSVAESNFAKALAASGGVMSIQAQRTQRELINSQLALRKFDDAQQAAARGGAHASTGLAAQRHLYRDLSRQVAGYGLLLAALPVGSLVTAAIRQRDFAEVVRTADPDFTKSTMRVEALRGSLVALTQAMPTSFGAVTEIATLGNQMGIAAEQTATFTTAVAMFSATSGVTVDMAATAFGRLKSILGDASIPFMDMADSILKVGVNSVATEQEIINVLTQVSSIAGAAGFSAKEMIALSGALSSVRVPPELSRGLITRVFGQIGKAVESGGTSLDTFARISGRTSEEVRKQWGREGSANLFNDFLRGLRDAGSAAGTELSALGINSVRDKPVLLRLANAADSDGNVGELFTQTLRDAHNAAGETQRQYTIMADTVIAKLKVLGNNLLAFLDAAGRGSLGMFGDLLDGLSTSIRNFTRDLDKPFKLLGLELKATNGQVLGLVSSIGLIVGTATLAGAAVFKAFSTIRGMQHLGQVTNITRGLTGLFDSMTKIVRPAQAATAATTQLVNVGKHGIAPVRTLGAAIGTFAKAIGPIGWIAAGAAAGIGIYNTAVRNAATDSSELAERIARFDLTDINRLDTALSSIRTTQSPFLIETLTNPFENGLEGLRDTFDAIEALHQQNTQFESVRGLTADIEAVSAAQRKAYGLEGGINAFKTMDETFQQLVDANNIPKATQMLQKMFRNGRDMEHFFANGGDNAKKFIDQAFNAAGLEAGPRAYDRFVKGQLPALMDGLYGVAGASKLIEEEIFDDVEALGAFSEAVDAAAASFLSFDSAIEAATTTDEAGKFISFDLATFTNTLDEQLATQEQWMQDVITISKYGSKGVIEALADLGPAGEHYARELAQGLLDGVPEAEAALAKMEEIIAAKTPGLGSTLAENMANQSWAAGIFGDANLARVLAQNLGDDKMSDLYSRAQGVGQETLQKILDGLLRGNISFEEALAELELKAPIEGSFELTGKSLDRARLALSQVLSDRYGIEMDVDINKERTVAELINLTQDPTLTTMQIDSSLSLEEAYASSAEFQAWAKEQRLELILGADPAAAYLSAELLRAYVNGTVTKIQIDALPELFDGRYWEIQKTVEGNTLFVPMNANGTPFEKEVAILLDEAGNEVATVKVDADDANARQVLDRLNNTHTSSTHTIFTVHSGANLHNAPIDMWDAALRGMANGGVLEAYANGGVRENHAAQIAPAGAMRLWAEPETGGEAYIPLAASKRQRSAAILNDVAQRFGYSLVRGATHQYADGGMYNASQMRRTMQYNTAPQQQANGLQGSWEFHVHNPVAKDPVRDMWNSINSYDPTYGFTQ